jgi:hypothetical protein
MKLSETERQKMEEVEQKVGSLTESLADFFRIFDRPEDEERIPLATQTDKLIEELEKFKSHTNRLLRP